MITSKKNEQVKQWKKLQTKKGRGQTGLFWIEGFHLVEEAVASDWEVHHIIVGENVQLSSIYADYPNTAVAEHVFDYLAETRQPQRIAAVVKMKQHEAVAGKNILLIDAVQDPGNLGTMIRTADAAGFDGVVAGANSVDMFNDKVIRATQGSLFHIPVVQQDLLTAIGQLKKNDFKVWAAALEGAETYTMVQPSEKTALLVGNEGAGISQTLLEKADTVVSIPIRGQAESLNVSIAAAILMYYIKG
ncbi:putative tRNA/rRNA methyltransferase YsgA [Lentibacillus sp. JNUCC-1]|uniref:TrmH family RNA methyltransferase n=1 Tax=Lentibacillus sp. JNUCC-1 TaxID=2654513 RepID=UPI0012E7C8C1|nr:RNA methyltransferase [Lentibacillus sp. JNUCC-1]MUV39372.1 putative tRNA/rRNA methyltransferase YsgA [Lentibacillus sp. JNUCC-1]